MLGRLEQSLCRPDDVRQSPKCFVVRARWRMNCKVGLMASRPVIVDPDLADTALRKAQPSQAQDRRQSTQN